MPTARSRLGSRGEALAKAYLKSKGYHIIESNFRCPQGEMDIVARDGAYLVFVEVRTRRDGGWYGSPEESISRRKRARLVAIAETYIQSCESPPD